MLSPRETQRDDFLQELANYVTLLYHEARNVRHLIKKGLIDKEPWVRVVSLNKNRDKAWADIQPVRREACSASNVAQLLYAFERRFGVPLESLLEMYRNQNWRHAKAYGGNAWAKITETVVEFAQQMENGEKAQIEATLNKLKQARHNNGELQEKLVHLDSTLSQSNAENDKGTVNTRLQ